MKRAVFVTALACALLTIFASAAYASTTSDYILWNAGGANSTSLGTPHADYQLTTEKCSVCHAVHKANATGQILLDATVNDACTYCHITTPAGNIQVYDGTAALWTTGSDQAHNASASFGCTDCHAVHGAGIVESGIANLDQKILLAEPDGRTPQAGTGWSYVTADRDEAVSLFCSACHPYFVGTYEGTHVGSLGDATSYKGHIMTDVTNNYSNPNASGAVQGTSVAYAPSTYCRNCHDAGEIDQGTGVWDDNFPHYTQGARFMKAATSTVDPSVVDAASPVQDGVCLKCHRDGTDGVGVNF